MTRQLVVCGLLWRAGPAGTQVLIGRRRDSGFWEFPGGKVEVGEEPEVALVREWREEFGVLVSVVHEALTEAVAISPGLELRAWWIKTPAEISPGSDHRELSWLTLTDFASVKLLPADAEICRRLFSFTAESPLPASSESITEPFHNYP